MKTPGLYWHESEGNVKIKLKNNLFYFFSNFQKIGLGGLEKRKIKNSGLRKLLKLHRHVHIIIFLLVVIHQGSL